MKIGAAYAAVIGPKVRRLRELRAATERQHAEEKREWAAMTPAEQIKACKPKPGPKAKGMFGHIVVAGRDRDQLIVDELRRRQAETGRPIVNLSRPDSLVEELAEETGLSESTIRQAWWRGSKNSRN